MKAVITTKYGSPDVLKLVDTEKPEPKDKEVLIKIHAASVGPADCALRKGKPFIVKILYGLRKPKFPILGTELSGEIEAVGKDVTLFEKGDQIFGLSPETSGAHAEYKCLNEDKLISLKPTNTTYQEAVGICDGATTALTFLRDKAHLKEGQKILINGASGAVGSYAIQIAKYYGAKVTAVCSGKNENLVKSLGADNVIDYRKHDFTKTTEEYDVIFDAVGNNSFGNCKKALKKEGIFLSTYPSLGIVLQMLWTSKFGNKKAIFAATGLEQKKENLVFLKELVETGKLKASIDRVYTLEQIKQAHEYVETGHKKGNVVITIA